MWQAAYMRKVRTNLRTSVRRRVAKAEMLPRYIVVADTLTTDIAKGRYPVGSTLPTEHELCEMFDVSRFTVREALRRLRDASLVTRKPRAGTTVIASHRPVPYTQSVESLEDLLQYAADTEMRMVSVGLAEAGSDLPGELPFPIGETWLFGVGVRFRRNDDRPICLTRVYINPIFSGVADHLQHLSGAIYQLIEEQYDVSVARVEQHIHAVPLSSEEALLLKAMVKDPALRIVRRYYASDGQLLEVSDNIHPATRFSYTITITRGK
jgi:GntR family transcriptional regulator